MARRDFTLKFRRETIKYGRRNPKPCQEDQRLLDARAQDFKFYAILNIYKADLVRGLISNGCAECFRARCGIGIAAVTRLFSMAPPKAAAIYLV